MYSIGEIVLYGSNGVCEITEITTKKIGKDSIEYYVLKPVCSDSSTLLFRLRMKCLCQECVLSFLRMKLKIFCHRKPIMKYGLTIKPKDVKNQGDYFGRRLYEAC